MQISFNPVQNRDNYYGMSFKAMKKSQFHGIDRFIVEKTKAPIEKFNVLDDFYKYCKELVDKVVKTDFGGRRTETTVQRKNMLKEWFNYVTKENAAYTLPIQLLVLLGITKFLKPNDDNMPPVLNKGVLADTVTEMQNELNKNEKAQFNFDKKYRLNLQKSIFNETEVLDKELNGWIVIPSKEHDPEHFENNVEKLKMLSHHNWCTKSYNAEPYLSKGDFHIYMENGKPELGVRFVNNSIQEIQGELNNGKIPFKHYDTIMSYVKDYELNWEAEDELDALDDLKAEVEKIKAKLPKGIENASTQEILENLDIKYKKDTDGLFIISHYGSSMRQIYSYSDLGIDENKLFKDIKEIRNNADFSDSSVSDLGNLKRIGGMVEFGHVPLQTLGKLEEIGKRADFRGCKFKSLGNLRKIGGDAEFCFSNIEDLGKLEEIGGHADFSDSIIKNLGDLRKIGKMADFENTEITSLDNLEEIGGNMSFEDTKITDLGNLRIICGDADFMNSKITSLGKLEEIWGDAFFQKSQIRDLGVLKHIHGGAYYDEGQFADMIRLDKICGEYDEYDYNNEDEDDYNYEDEDTFYDEDNYKYDNKSDDDNLYNAGKEDYLSQFLYDEEY